MPTSPALRPAPAAASLLVTEEDFRLLQEFFYRHTGIVFGDAKRYFVDRRLAERLQTSGCPDMRAYLRHLRFDAAGPQELQALVDALTVNETYFWREAYQFRCLVTHLLPELAAQRRDGAPLRLWSLPCSTGEEAYSMALHVLEDWPGLAQHDVEILGSDIDSRVLKRAQEGRYEARSVQNLPPAILERHFARLPDGAWRISEALREAVAFRAINLHDRAAMRAEAGQWDVIFCRNLLIYFDDVSRRQAAQALFEALRLGGFLCLGHSESMSRISALFTVRKFPDAIVYQRPLA